MNHPRRQSRLRPLMLLAATAGLAAMAALPPGGATKAVQQSQHIKETVDALFKHRLKPEPLPVILPNPFRIVSGSIRAKRGEGGEADAAAEAESATGASVAATAAAEPPPPTTDAEALARHVAALKIGGAIELNGQLQLIINQFPRKEGDLIFLDNRNAVQYLKIIRLTPLELTVGFNDAVQTVRLKN